MQKTKKEKSSRIRSGKTQKKILPNFNRKTRQEKIKENENKALNTLDLNNILNGVENFLGVFASDELSEIRIISTPVFIISNLDISTSPGSHWLCIRIDQNSIEIFDSLGFDRKLWGKFPKGLQNFLSRFRYSHNFYFSPVLQPENTSDCGLYCVYFILFRPLFSFSDCVSTFSRLLTRNHSILINKLKSLYIK